MRRRSHHHRQLVRAGQVRFCGVLLLTAGPQCTVERSEHSSLCSRVTMALVVLLPLPGAGWMMLRQLSRVIADGSPQLTEHSMQCSMSGCSPPTAASVLPLSPDAGWSALAWCCRVYRRLMRQLVWRKAVSCPSQHNRLLTSHDGACAAAATASLGLW